MGDRVTLKGTIFPGNWEFVLRGIYKGGNKSVDESMFVFHWDYLNETIKKTAPGRGDQAGWYLIGISDRHLSAQVAASIDSLFRNSLAETLTETEKAFQLGFIAMTEAILIAIRIVSFVVIGVIMIVVANTMAMTARERRGEYAVLKTMGFGWQYIAGLIAGESLLITSLGCSLGIALTYPAARIFSSALSVYFPVFNVSEETIVMDAASAIIVGLAASALPIWKSITVPIAEGLRRIG
ncbi:MAG: ABC transporter permease [Nitrospirales bacterium]|nr:ABC transporter permease [Nitrospirales bacterium]